MSIGGNQNLKEFFSKYNLNEENNKFSTNAADYYRRKLKF
jgi:hypothetical protein